MVRDRIVVGILDVEYPDPMTPGEDPTLQKAIQIACQAEQQTGIVNL